MEPLDPNLYHIDYGRLTEVLISIVVFSFFIERALSVIFESRVFIDLVEETQPAASVVVEETTEQHHETTKVETQEKIKTKKKGVRELIAVIASVAFCFAWDFDAITILLVSDTEMSVGGTIITGFIIAGGSKASMGLFKDLLGFMSSAEKARQEVLKKQIGKA